MGKRSRYGKRSCNFSGEAYACTSRSRSIGCVVLILEAYAIKVRASFTCNSCVARAHDLCY